MASKPGRLVAVPETKVVLMPTPIPDPERPVEPDDLAPEEPALPDDERPVDPVEDEAEVLPDEERPVPPEVDELLD